LESFGTSRLGKTTHKRPKKTTGKTGPNNDLGNAQETDREAIRSMSLDLKRRLIAQLVESSRLLRNYIDHRAKERGTTRAQWIVLFRLRQQEGLSQVDLADVLELQPISLVRLLDRLVEHGLLERRPDPKDRRANRLFLTQSGRQLVDDLDSLRDAIATDVLRDVPADALQTSLDTLVEVKDRIKSFGESPDIAVK
jgi:DNA-binding MarR family transcriptional regulator